MSEVSTGIRPIVRPLITINGGTLTVDWSKARSVEFETPAETQQVEGADPAGVYHQFTGRHELTLRAVFDGNPFEWVPDA